MSTSTSASEGGANGHAQSSSGSIASSRVRSSSDSSANVPVSEELAHKTNERFCQQLVDFADPVNTNPGIKRPGEERTERLWVHAKGVRMETKCGIRVSWLCVCTKSLVRENCGVQPVTHTNGTFCGGNVVVAIKTQHPGRY
jgi:hypothetical protein